MEFKYNIGQQVYFDDTYKTIATVLSRRTETEWWFVLPRKVNKYLIEYKRHETIYSEVTTERKLWEVPS